MLGYIYSAPSLIEQELGTLQLGTTLCPGAHKSIQTSQIAEILETVLISLHLPYINYPLQLQLAVILLSGTILCVAPSNSTSISDSK